MYVKPAPREIEGRALVVRDPDLLDFLPTEGREVPDSDYWHRRLRDGDVVLAAPHLVVGDIAAGLGIAAATVAADAAKADYRSTD